MVLKQQLDENRTDGVYMAKGKKKQFLMMNDEDQSENERIMRMRMGMMMMMMMMVYSHTLRFLFLSGIQQKLLQTYWTKGWALSRKCWMFACVAATGWAYWPCGL